MILCVSGQVQTFFGGFCLSNDAFLHCICLELHFWGRQGVLFSDLLQQKNASSTFFGFFQLSGKGYVLLVGRFHETNITVVQSEKQKSFASSRGNRKGSETSNAQQFRIYSF